MGRKMIFLLMTAGPIVLSLDRNKPVTRTNSMKKTEMVRLSGPADMGKLVSDHHCFSIISTNPASFAIPPSPPNFMLFPCKQSSYPYANLNHRAFWPSQ